MTSAYTSAVSSTSTGRSFLLSARRNFERAMFCSWTPFANLIHAESAPRGHQPTTAEQAQFLREAIFMQQKWGLRALARFLLQSQSLSTCPGFELALRPRLPEERFVAE